VVARPILSQAEKTVQMMKRQYADYKEDAPGRIPTTSRAIAA